MSSQASGIFEGRRIAIFEPHPDFATNPSLLCLSEALVRSGAEVDLFMSAPGRYPPADSNNLTRYPFPRRLSLLHRGIRPTLRGWQDGLQRLRIDRVSRFKTYDLIIGIDSEGVIIGCDYARRFNVPLVYISFEIFFRDELFSGREIVEKGRERIASQFASLVIVQDQWRAELLASENNLPLAKFEFLPVSPRASPKVQGSDYLQRHFNISEKRVVVLHSGSFAGWTCADELLENVATWPEGFVMVVHTRYKPTEDDKYVQTIRHNRSSNIILSTEPLPQDEYEEMVASAHIGLVLYKSAPISRYTQKNLETIGLASGKFSMYMKYGVPVVSIGQKCYAELLAGYGFGENISSFDEMPAALNRLWSNHAYHRAEAERLFTEKLDFDIYWPILATRLAKVLR